MRNLTPQPAGSSSNNPFSPTRDDSFPLDSSTAPTASTSTASRALIPPPPPPHRTNNATAYSSPADLNPFRDDDDASLASDHQYYGTATTTQQYPGAHNMTATASAQDLIASSTNNSSSSNQLLSQKPSNDRNLPLPQSLDNNISSGSSASSSSSNSFSNSNNQLLNHQQQYPSSYNDILPTQQTLSPASAMMMPNSSGISSTRPSSTNIHAMGGAAAGAAGGAAAGTLASAEFDRYPNRISSAAPSIASGSGAPLLIRDGYPVFSNPNSNNNLLGSDNGGSSTVLPSGAASATNASGVRNSFSNDSAASSFSDTDSYGASNPFVVNSDFSPFGGYPASSFPLHMEEKEADDYLHNPDPILDAKYDRKCQRLDKRGWASLTALLCLLLGGICIFVILPILTYSGITEEHRVVATKEVEVLTNYEYNILGAIRTSLVDADTPSSARNYTAMDGSSWNLVFSDEFNKEGRTFYDGDDQFWTAPDIHYQATKDLEWYDPDASTTANGTLVFQLDAFKNHDLYYRSGMLQSWNKFCFTQGKLEVSAKLPGNGSILGLWPGIWTLGNLVRPGYLASAEGVWPYSYNSCDAGITPNQSSSDGLSYLKGQRLNACTCPGADHPNPGVGRGGPEIDALEGTVDSGILAGVASQSLQIAPYDIWYYPDINFIEVYNKTVSLLNTWNGGPLQQAVSMASSLNATWYEISPTPRYQKYGFEYLNDDTDGYIRWFIGDSPVFTIFAPALGPNGNVGQRTISKEPMSIILNLGISTAWVYIDWPSLTWPSRMRIDYVRVYQPKNAVNVGCDPSGYPTYDYINAHPDVYANPNLTIWDDTPYEWPKNKLTGC